MPKTYDREFKIEAVRMASEPGVPAIEIEKRLGIGQGVLSRWKRQFKMEAEKAFPGKGHMKNEVDELRRLKRENDHLRRERDILNISCLQTLVEKMNTTKIRGALRSHDLSLFVRRFHVIM